MMPSTTTRQIAEAAADAAIAISDPDDPAIERDEEDAAIARWTAA